MKRLKWIFLVVIICLIGCAPSSQKKVEYGRGTAYVQAQYEGLAISLSSGSNEPDLFHPKKNDLKQTTPDRTQTYPGAIHSAHIGKGLKCEFYQDADYHGKKLGPLGEGDYPDFKEKGWNDNIKSIKCYPAT
jgi:hypothetical protein